MAFGGRSWCGWHCFFAGLEDGVSRIRKKAFLKKPIDRKWVYFSFALMLFVMILSPIVMSPVYCDWLCPLKAISEYEVVDSIQTALKTVIFIVLFLILVLLIPLITSKRAQCSFFCPFGAFMGLANRISPFEMAIERDKCTDCKKCIRVCPTYAIDEESLKKGRTCINCYKCGKCMDQCPTGAISYHIKGTRIGIRSNIARIMFLYPTMLLYAMIGGGMIREAAFRILLFVTTGSMLV
jgi:polyferredoxin